MRVLTYTQEEFDLECRRLREAVRSAFGSWDVVIGIASGGVPVARNLLPDNGLQPLTVTLRRPATKMVKQPLLKRWLAALPRPVLDRLRIMESRLYALRDRRDTAPPAPVALNEELRGSLLALEEKKGSPLRILIADDAADSGTTIRRVRRALRELLPRADIATAVMTVTRQAADDAADYSLYRDGTLIRFPWSKL